MERPKGIEALKTLPFREVALPLDEAEKLLTESAERGRQTNVAQLTGTIPDRYLAEYIRDGLLQTPLDPGGYTLTHEDLQELYEMGHKPFRELHADVYRRLVATLGEDAQISRNSGVNFVGGNIDMLALVRPEVAGEHDRYGVLVEVAREHSEHMPLFTIGAALDDAMHLRGGGPLPIEVLLPQTEVTKFGQGILRHLSESEKEELAQGYAVTVQELQVALRVN